MTRLPGSEPQGRRAFLRTAAGYGGVFFGGSLLTACGASAPSISPTAMALRGIVADNHPIGIQLYTVRDQLQSDFEGTLRKVAAIGYREFEFAGYYDRTPAQIRALLDELDVTAPASHLGLNLFRQDIDKLMSEAQVLGHQYLVVPSANGRTVDGWKQLAADFNAYGLRLRNAGLRFGYHNHAAEFQDLGGGVSAFDILLQETDPDLVDLELDLYWAVRGGQDPVALFARAPGRYKLFHVKDMADRTGEQTMAPVGEGEMDFAAIFAAARQAGVDHFFVEHDNAAEYAGGSLASITKSYGNLRRMLP